MALELQEAHKRAGFSVLVSSPYRRCLQTAAEVARLLGLPVIIDQEIGDVWDEAALGDRPAHRSSVGLQGMTRAMGIRVLNPMLPEGGLKLYGQRPASGETVAMARKRSLVRMQTYIEQSAARQQNLIFVSHLPAVTAMFDMCLSGKLLVDRLDTCCRVMATRRLLPTAKENGIFEDEWDMESRGIHAKPSANTAAEDPGVFRREVQQLSRERALTRSRTDLLLEQSLRDLQSVGAEPGRPAPASPGGRPRTK